MDYSWTFSLALGQGPTLLRPRFSPEFSHIGKEIEMVAIFSHSHSAGGSPSMAWPDVCRVPEPTHDSEGKPLLGRYPDGTLILVSKETSARKIYGVKSGSAKELPLRNVESAPTFILLEDGNVMAHEHECRTQDSARQVVAHFMGARTSAIVISIDAKGEAPLAFHVTPRSTRDLKLLVRQLP